jgi:YgiT-type zinc finger domain-containing protein
MLMSFWESEHCEYCNGKIVEKRVRLHRRVKRKDIFIDKVPAGVCTQCGARYFSANVLKTVGEIERGRRKADREVCVPVYSL